MLDNLFNFIHPFLTYFFQEYYFRENLSVDWQEWNKYMEQFKLDLI